MVLNIDFRTILSGLVLFWTYCLHTNSYAQTPTCTLVSNQAYPTVPVQYICLGDTVEFTATASGNVYPVTNGMDCYNLTSTYDLYSLDIIVNNNYVAFSPTLSNTYSLIPSSTGIYNVKAATIYNYDTPGCFGSIDVYSNTIQVQVASASTLPTVSISGNGSGNTLCANSTNLIATTTYAGYNPTFVWKRNGTVINGATSNVLTSNTFSVNDVITCEMTSSVSCITNPAAVSNSLTITAPVSPALSISSNMTNPVCPNLPLIFTATTTNSGSNPVYQWSRNGAPYANATSSTCTIMPATLFQGDDISCTMTPNTGCFTSVAPLSNSFIIPSLIPHVTLSHSPSTICQGGTVTLSASTNNAGGCGYLWQSRPTNTAPWTTISGATASSYTTTLSAQTFFRTIRTCGSCSPDTSSSYSIFPYTPTVSVSNGSQNICHGAIAYLTSNVSPAYNMTYFYQWQNSSNGTTWTNAPNGYTSAQFVTPPVTSTQYYRVMVTSTAPLTNCNATSNPVSYTPQPAINLQTTPASAAFCGAGSQVFTASGANSYTWSPASGLSATSGATVTANPSASTNYTLTGTSGSCSKSISVGFSRLTSPGITSVSILSDKGTTTCSGTPVTFSPQFTPAFFATGSFLYQWKVNGTTVATTPAFTTSSLNNGDVIDLTVSSNLACQLNTLNAASVTMTIVNYSGSPGVTISAPGGVITCVGDYVTFTATATNAGANPTYHWWKNGVYVGQASSSNTITFLAAGPGTYPPNAIYSGDIIRCELVANSTCSMPVPVLSNSVTMNVMPTGSWDYYGIECSQRFPVCVNQTVTFSRVLINSTIPNPGYQWKKNGVAIPAATNTSYTAVGLINGDIISCDLLTNNACQTIAPSNNITYTTVGSVGSLYVPAVEIGVYTDYDIYAPPKLLTLGSYPACTGQQVNLYTQRKFEGNNPTYQWKVNGMNAGLNSPNYSYTPTFGSLGSDIIICEMTSNADCAATSTVVSDTFTVFEPYSNGDILNSFYHVYPSEVCHDDTVYFETLFERHCNDNCNGINYDYPTFPSSIPFGNMGEGQVYTLVDSSSFNLNVNESPWYFWTTHTPIPTNCPTGLNDYVPIHQIGQPTTGYFSNTVPAISISELFGSAGCNNASSTRIFKAATSARGKNGTLQWKVNGVNQTGQIYETFATNTLQSGDIVTCQMTSGLSCVVNPVVVSNGINANANQCISITSINSLNFCPGNAATINFTAANVYNPGNVFTAELSNASGSFSNPIVIGTLTSGTGGVINVQIPTNIPAGTGYRVRIVSSSPNLTSFSNGSNININNPTIFPIATASLNSVCVGGSVTFTNTVAGAASPYTLQWQMSSNGINFSNIPAANASAYTTTFNTPGTYQYRIAVVKSGQCNGYSSPITVTVHPDPSVTLTGGTSFCGNGSAVLTANPVYGAGTNTLNWQISANNSTWSNVSNTNNVTYTTPTLSGTRYYRTVLSANGNGCGSTVISNTQTIQVNPVPTLVLNPSLATICDGGSRTLQVSSSVGGTTFSWSPGTGLNTTTGSSVIANPAVTTAYTVSSATTAGCTKTGMVTVTVVPDAYISSITGTAALCSGGSSLLTANVAGGTGTCNVSWQSSTNGTTWTTILIPNTATTYIGNTYQTPALTNSVWYRARVTGCSGSGCGASGYSNSFMVTVSPDPVVTISSNANPVCNNGTATLTATLTGGTGSCPYTWQISPDGITWTNTGGNTGTINLYNIIATKYVRAMVNCNGTGCNSDTSNVIQLNVAANPTASLTGGGTYAQGNQVTLTATVTGGSGTCTYSWFTRPNTQTAFSVIPGQNTATYSFPATATAQYRAQAFCTSCGSVYTNIPTVTVVPIRLGAPGTTQEEEEKLQEYMLYPNPAFAEIIVEGNTDNTAPIFLDIFDVTGRKTISLSEYPESGTFKKGINIAELSPGVYFCHIKQNDHEQIIKFVKQ
ncbi:MAG: T9SS type A sorting domain-containing protein [Bacteroidia bacterium]|nr:T9SS type A sorting domain-containing protein [Bacteroidia bacterium]